MGRYARTDIIGLNFRYGTSFYIPAIRDNIANGNIRYQEIILQESNRLDILAGKYYGDGRRWDLIAAASNVGWGLQCPPGTVIRIPNLTDALRFAGG